MLRSKLCPRKWLRERTEEGNEERVPVKSVTRVLPLMAHPSLVIHRTLYHIVLRKVCCDLEPRGGNIIYTDNTKLAPVAYLRLYVNFPTSKGTFPYSHIKIATAIYPDFLSVLSFRCHGNIVFWVAMSSHWELRNTLWEIVTWLICSLFSSQWNRSWFVETNQLIFVEWMNQWFIRSITEITPAWNQRLNSQCLVEFMLWFLKKGYVDSFVHTQ